MRESRWKSDGLTAISSHGMWTATTSVKKAKCAAPMTLEKLYIAITSSSDHRCPQLFAVVSRTISHCVFPTGGFTIVKLACMHCSSDISVSPNANAESKLSA